MAGIQRNGLKTALAKWKAQKAGLLQQMVDAAHVHFEQSFEQQGFTDNKLEKWQPLKEPDNEENASDKKGIFHYHGKSKHKAKTNAKSKAVKNKNRPAEHKILVKSGALRGSLQKEVKGLKGRIFSMLPYAAVHNFGLRAGRGKGFMMPKREFLGHSGQLDKKLVQIIKTHLKKLKP